jgi:hypothetical protein
MANVVNAPQDETSVIGTAAAVVLTFVGVAVIAQNPND